MIEVSYSMKCDICKEYLYDSYDEYDCGVTFIDNKKNLIGVAVVGGWHVNNGEHYCPDCYTVDENGNVILLKI